MRDLRFFQVSLYFPYKALGDDWFTYYPLFADMISATHRWRTCQP